MNYNLSNFEFRLTCEDDWEILKAIRLQSLFDSPDAFTATYATTEKYHEKEWRNRAAQRTNNQYILAIHNARAVGIVGGTLNSELEFNVIAMWVNLLFRGSGIVDHLIVAVKKLAISKGHHRIVLSVSDHNLHAKNLYLKHGFQFISKLDGISLRSDATDTKSQKMECSIKAIDLD